MILMIKKYKNWFYKDPQYIPLTSLCDVTKVTNTILLKAPAAEYSHLAHIFVDSRDADLFLLSSLDFSQD